MAAAEARLAQAGLALGVGSMLESQALIRRTKRALIAQRSAQLFTPAPDHRCGTKRVWSLGGGSLFATTVRDALARPDEARCLACHEVRRLGAAS